MIGVDTNVLARFFIDDDGVQHQKAISFFSDRSVADPAFVSCVVIVELVWLLSGRFRFSYDRIFDVLQHMLDSPDFVVEHASFVEQSIGMAKEDKVDFADCVISFMARINGCGSIVTFDKRAAKRVYGMDLLS